MKKKRLMTPTEERVLIDLIKYQDKPDKEIAEMRGMAASNFAVVKRHLEEKSILRDMISINMQKIKEAKVMAFVWLAYKSPVREKYREELDRIRMNFPVACTYGSKDWSINLDYFRSFEEAENARLKLCSLLNEKLEPYLSEYIWKVVPLSHLIKGNLESRLIEYTISHKSHKVACTEEQGECSFAVPRAALKNLTSTEKKVLIGLRRYPGMKKSEIAKRVGLQQSSFSEIFRNLHKRGVIASVRQTDPSRLPGREMSTFTWIEFNQPLTTKEQKEALDSLLDSIPQVYRIYATRTFIFMITFNHSLEKSEDIHLMLLDKFGDNLAKFNFKVVPTNHLTITYTPYFIEKAFGYDEKRPHARLNEDEE